MTEMVCPKCKELMTPSILLGDGHCNHCGADAHEFFLIILRLQRENAALGSRIDDLMDKGNDARWDQNR